MMPARSRLHPSLSLVPLALVMALSAACVVDDVDADDDVVLADVPDVDDTATTHKDVVCSRGDAFCAHNLHLEQTITSNGRVLYGVAEIHLTSGSIRVRIIHKHVGPDRVLAHKVFNEPGDYLVNGFTPNIISRHMRVVIDQVVDATYDAKVGFGP